MAKIKFGTDGWRAVIAEDFTFANVSRVAQATASYWNANPIAGTEKRAVVGYDRRFLSNEFAQRTAEILAANGFIVTLTNCPTPTPAVSWTVKKQNGSGGVMLPHYSPLKVAENFSMLASLYPGRIDLGLGRAPGTSAATSRPAATGISGSSSPCSTSVGTDTVFRSSTRSPDASTATQGVLPGCWST